MLTTLLLCIAIIIVLFVNIIIIVIVQCFDVALLFSVVIFISMLRIHYIIIVLSLNFT